VCFCLGLCHVPCVANVARYIWIVHSWLLLRSVLSNVCLNCWRLCAFWEYAETIHTCFEHISYLKYMTIQNNRQKHTQKLQHSTPKRCNKGLTIRILKRYLVFLNRRRTYLCAFWEYAETIHTCFEHISYLKYMTIQNNITWML
jgi:hypothetical protein